VQLTWAICDELGRVRDWLTERSSASVDIGLNAQRTATVTASIEDHAVQTVRPGKSRLKVYCHPESGDENSFLLINGLINQPKVDGTRVELPAVDVTGRLQNASSAPFPVKSAAIDPFWQIELLEQSAWMWLIIDRSDSRAHNLNIAEPTRPPVPKMGIVEGTLADSGIYLIRKPGDTQATWDELIARSKMNNAPDFEFAPVDEDGTFAAFNTYWPKQGTDRSEAIILEYGFNMSEFSWEPSGAALCNRVVLVGLGKGRRAPVWVAENHHSMRKYGVWSQTKSTPDTRDITVLQARAEEFIARRAKLVNFIDVTPNVEIGGVATGFRRDALGNLDPIQGPSFAIPPAFGPGSDFDYWIGDTITVRAKDQFKVPLDRLPGQPESDIYVRITDAHFEEVDESGNVAVSLTSTPEIHHADVSGYESEVVVESEFSGFSALGP
jgi:hypothetical protein